MSSFLVSVVCLAVLSVEAAQGMDCSIFGSQNIIDQAFSHCPNPIQAITNPEKAYCCPTTDRSFECCDLPTFLLTGVLIPVLIIGIVLSFIISCICCFCCPFCCIYKRRTGGGAMRSLNQQDSRFPT